ncbi:MAG: hypothetical protein WC307_03005 [Candidatus Nanoarchaeia archaeon]
MYCADAQAFKRGRQVFYYKMIALNDNIERLKRLNEHYEQNKILTSENNNLKLELRHAKYYYRTKARK